MTLKMKYHCLGLMSGTSLDGIDLAICTLIKDTCWQFKINKATTIKYPNYWIEKLTNLHTRNSTEIAKTNIEYGRFLGENINKFLENEKIDFIASHGHTIFHQPNKNYTLQIGDGQEIANTTKITTINNFRKLDISLNGQGAPLVPIGDLYLFSNYKNCINLGGFANISIKEKNQIIAFDICPANIVLNKISQKLNMDFDINGENAKKGSLIPELLEKLNNLKYYKELPPKSLSREWVEEFIYPLFLKKYKDHDVLHTFCEHIGIQIGKYLNKETTFFTGGGAFNSYLMERISYHCKSMIFIPNKKIINFKEALIFAFLGVLRVRNEVNCLKSVTGARRNCCGGEINNPIL